MDNVSEVRIELQDEGHYLLHGELSFNTVSAISANFAKMVNKSDEIILDLHGVTRTDSAGLALLIDWLRSARHEHKRIVFKNMPSQMLAVAKVSELDDILPLE
jgi:phospholipid transport system transporter-binding protein